MLNKMPKQPTYQAAEITQLRHLIWSNSIDNDLLVLELLRNNGVPDSLEADIVSVAITTEEERVKLAYRTFLQEKLSNEAYLKISDIKFVNFNSVLCDQLQANFSVADLIYTYYKRTGVGIENFLLQAGNTSTYRLEIFKDYVAQIKSKLYTKYRYKPLNVVGLTKQELTTVLEDDAIAATPISRVSIKRCKLNTLPAALFEMSNIQDLKLLNIGLEVFPEKVFELVNLNKLYFVGMHFSEIPKDWSALKNLESLVFRNSTIKIDNFDFIATMPKLKRLELGKSYLPNPYMLLTNKTLPLTHWDGFSAISKYPRKDFLTFASAVSRSILSMEDKRFFFDTVRGIKQIQDLPNLSFHQLLKALSINHAPLREICLNRLENMVLRLNGIASLEKGTVLHIIGGTTMKKTDIRSKLKELSIGYSPKFSPKVTHVLIGKNPKHFEINTDQTLNIITENQLQKFFSEKQPQYLEQAAESGQKEFQGNLVDLLRSPDTANAMLAIEMLKSGGVPPDLMEELLVTQKTNIDSKVRAAAKKLLELYAPAEWLPLIRDKQHFAMIGKKIREQDLNIKLTKIAQKASRELAAMLSLALFKVHRKGLRYILYHFIKPHRNRTKAFQAMMQGTHCDYTAGLGFTNLKDRTPDRISLFKMKTGAAFPVDVLDVIDKVESIDFHNCKFDKLHQSIGKFIDLKQLNCSCNTLSKLPKTIRHLKKLETLDLSNNVFKEFPMEVLMLPNLKQLDLRHMHDYNTGGFHVLDIPIEVKTQLPDCEVLL